MSALPAAGATARVARLWISEFRCFESADVRFADGLTVLTGANGQGKTSLLEAVGWVARSRSFRGVPDAALVRTGAEIAVVRAEILTGERTQLFEAEVRANGRNRVLINRNPAGRARDRYGLLRVTVFSPDDLELVKGGPSERRAYLDDLLSMLAARYDAARGDLERVLRQRNALLRSGVRDDEARTTLDVFDEQLVRSGSELVRGRLRLVERLGPAVADAYRELADAPVPVEVAYDAEWAAGALDIDAVDDIPERLRAALAARRRDEIDRGMTLVGPQRDELRLLLGDLDARTHASQGEQRTLALALRLAGHDLCSELTHSTPVLLLDDVFSELDARRAAALVHRLPAGQTLLTTAGAIPDGVQPQRTLRVVAGRVEPEES
ncbi:MAG TPA: DNA replication/repair protein RecF [Acidimicrobiia bacterium]|nr:DNA replication/repair protein RecF [Acidimicrobiia bacterium]